MSKKAGQYPDSYGTRKPGALPDILGPLNVESQGDKLVPPNDMAEVGGEMADGVKSPDPLGLIDMFGDGTKGGK
jgi:hypothetical protein